MSEGAPFAPEVESVFSSLNLFLLLFAGAKSNSPAGETCPQPELPANTKKPTPVGEFETLFEKEFLCSTKTS